MASANNLERPGGLDQKQFVDKFSTRITREGKYQPKVRSLYVTHLVPPPPPGCAADARDEAASGLTWIFFSRSLPCHAGCLHGAGCR